MSIARVPSTIFFGAFSGLLFDFLSEIKLGKRKARKGTLQPHTQIPIAIPHPSIDASRSSRDSPDAAWRASGRGNRHLHPRERARVQNAPPPRRRPPRARVSHGSMTPDISTASAQRQTCQRSVSTDPSLPPPSHTPTRAQVAARRARRALLTRRRGRDQPASH
jgi:hypothetical protein